MHHQNLAKSKFCTNQILHNPCTIQILYYPNFAWSKFCTIQILHDPNFANSKRGRIQIMHNPNITPSKAFIFLQFIYQGSIVMGCACLDMNRIFFLFFWGEITTVHKWQLGRKAKNSLRPEEQYHTNWWSVRKFKENFGHDWVQFSGFTHNSTNTLRVRNKHRGTLINFCGFFPRATPLLEGAIFIEFWVFKKTY